MAAIPCPSIPRRQDGEAGKPDRFAFPGKIPLHAPERQQYLGSRIRIRTKGNVRRSHRKLRFPEQPEIQAEQQEKMGRIPNRALLLQAKNDRFRDRSLSKGERRRLSVEFERCAHVPRRHFPFPGEARRSEGSLPRLRPRFSCRLLCAPVARQAVGKRSSGFRGRPVACAAGHVRLRHDTLDSNGPRRTFRHFAQRSPLPKGQATFRTGICRRSLRRLLFRQEEEQVSPGFSLQLRFAVSR